MAYLLLTGVTGLLGRYLLKDLLLADVPVAVLVRPTRRATARQRVENVMCYWDEQVGYSMTRPVVLEGDITEPDLGLDPRSIRWVAEHCDTMLHNAASLTFQSTGPESEPWRSNVAGVNNVLDLCRNARIRKFHHVSTAYVCGQREGRIFESELDVGQKMSNDYEQSKVQAEKLVRSADFLDQVTVFRPAIIIGDSQNCHTTTYHGFYAPLQLVHTMAQNFTPNETGRLQSPAHFSLHGHETKNLVPVDWVSAVTAHVITHPEHHCKTYHLTPRHPVTFRLIADVLEQAVGFYGISFSGGEQRQSDLTEYEQMFEDLIISIYNSYWRNDPTFDATNTVTAAPHLPCPHVDRNMLLNMSDYAIRVSFDGPRSKPTPPAFDAFRAIEPLVDALDQLHESDSALSRVGLQITGHGGGQWDLLLRNGSVVGADEGIDSDSSTTLGLEVETFASMARRQLTAEEAFAHGRVRVTGTGFSRQKLIGILQNLADSSQTQALVSH